jgi:hypothetical protein
MYHGLLVSLEAFRSQGLLDFFDTRVARLVLGLDCVQSLLHSSLPGAPLFSIFRLCIDRF